MNRSLAHAAAVTALALAACGGSKSSPPPPPAVPPPPLALTNFQAASVAIGHADLSTGSSSAHCDGSSLWTPTGSVAWDGGHLFVPDTGQNRVLAWSGIPTASGAGAAFAVGQSTLTDCVPDLFEDVAAPTTVCALPASAASTSRLFVTDPGTGDNRILGYSPAPNANGPMPAIVVGHPDLSTFGAGTTEATLSNPQGAFVVGNQLFVADSGNNRILIWRSLPTPAMGSLASAGAADRVLGAVDFVTPGGGAPDAQTLNNPTDVWSDGTRIVVADRLNNRVLIWNAFPATNGAPADVVIGHVNMTSATAAAGTTGMSAPSAVAFDGKQLFVADTGNNRVLVFPSIPTTNGASATIVLGQSHPSGTLANAGGTSPTAQTLAAPTGVAVIDQALFVTDTGNDRVLVFRSGQTP